MVISTTPSDKAQERFNDVLRKLNWHINAERLWNVVFSEEERSQLGGDFETALREHHVVEMWIALHGVNQSRAVIDAGYAINLLTDSEYKWLLREGGEPEPEQMGSQWTTVSLSPNEIAATKIVVIVERPRQFFWDGREYDCDWDRFNAQWNFLCELVRCAKRGNPIDRFDIAREARDRKIVSKRKSRLKSLAGFPSDFISTISIAGMGTQRLDVSPDMISILQVEQSERLMEWRP